MSRHPAILYLGIVPFRSAWQRPQQLAAVLAEQSQLLYVNPPRSPLGALRHAIHPPAVLEQDTPDGMTVFQPRPILPLSGYVPGVNRCNYASIARQLKAWIRDGKFPVPDAIVASFPKQVDLLEHFPGVPVLYDVMDDYPLFFDAWQGANLSRMHERLLRAADAAVASSQTLAERCRPACRQCTVITNGVHHRIVEAFPAAEADRSLAHLPRPRFGYVGSISKWFDFASVTALAETFPSGSVVIVGPSDIAVPKLPVNVHLLGPRTQQQLPAMLAGFDVGIVPFVRSPEIDAVNPVKVYEYFAAGLPVLSATFSEMLVFEDLVLLADSPAQWPEMAQRALLQGCDDRIRSRRQRLARESLWVHKGRQFREVLDDLLGRRLRSAA